MSKFKGSPTCIDCGVLHGRPPQASLCLGCADSRKLKRRDTPMYRAYQTRWNQSPKAKLRKGVWYERNRERCLARLKAWHKERQAEKVPVPTKCHALLCENTFIRVKGSHRMFCDPCALAFYGPSYLRHRGRHGRAA